MTRHVAKVTSKGQITLPSEMRKELGIKAGDQVDFRKNDSGNFEIVAKTFSLADLRGLIKTNVILSDAELENAISESWQSRWDRLRVQPGEDES